MKILAAVRCYTMRLANSSRRFGDFALPQPAGYSSVRLKTWKQHVPPKCRKLFSSRSDVPNS